MPRTTTPVAQAHIHPWEEVMDVGDRAGAGGSEVTAVELGVAEAGKGHGTEEAEQRLRRAREAD
jgi:hypothetical protein